MKLAVFDLDGTLARTNEADRECYAHALREVSALERVSTDWASYEHATDEAILNQLFRERFGRAITSSECEAIKTRLIELFAARHGSDPMAFLETPGAGSLLVELPRRGWGAALATGSWRCSADFKIRHSGLPLASLPAAYAENGPSRERIVSTAIARAKERYGTEFVRTVSVGDGIWDLRTASRLGLPFLGVADEPIASELRAHGARDVIGDFRDVERVLRLLDAVEVPRVPGSL